MNSKQTDSAGAGASSLNVSILVVNFIHHSQFLLVIYFAAIRVHGFKLRGKLAGLCWLKKEEEKDYRAAHCFRQSMHLRKCACRTLLKGGRAIGRFASFFRKKLRGKIQKGEGSGGDEK